VRDLPLGDNSEAKWRDPVRRVAFAPDGTVVYATSGRTELTAWEVPTGKKLWTADFEYMLAVDPKGRWLVTAATRELPVKWRLVDAKTGTLTEVEIPARRGGYSPFLSDLIWLPDGSRFVAAHWDGTVRLWDPDSRKEVRRLAMKAGTDRCLAVSADGRWLAVGASDRTVSVWELATGSRVLDLAGHDSPVTQVAFTKDGRGLVSNADLSPVLWDLCPKDLPTDGLWELLADADAAKAYRAQWALIKDPAAAVKLLGEKVKPADGAVTRKQFDQWVADLDSPQFRAREAAEKGLSGGVPVRWLRKALADAKTDESRTRLGRALAGREKEAEPDAGRSGRAVQVLELIGTADARALLKTWATGGGGLADEAGEALERLAKR